VLGVNGNLYLAMYLNTGVNAGNGVTVMVSTTNGSTTIIDHQFASSYQASTELITSVGNGSIVSISDGMFNISGSYNNMIRNHTDNITIGSTSLDVIDPSNHNSGLAVDSFKTGGGFVILNNIETESFGSGGEFSLLAFNTNLTVKTAFGTNGKLTINSGIVGFGKEVFLRDLLVTNTHIYVIGSFINGQAPTDYQSFCAIRITLVGALDTTYGDNGIAIVSINSKNDYGRAAVYSTSRNKLVVVGDTDILINSPSYTNPHNKSGTIGSLQTEIGVVFLDATGALS
jgi:hypothetical protein